MIHNNAYGYARYGFYGHAFAGDPTLAPGAKGPAVAEAQSLLIQAGYSVGKAGADGDYGANTTAAVVKFNADKLNRSQATIDQIMWDSLRSVPKVVAPPYITSTISLPDGVLATGGSGVPHPSWWENLQSGLHTRGIGALPWGWIGAGLAAFVGVVALSGRKRKA